MRVPEQEIFARAVRSSRVSATTWIATFCALGAATWAFAGLYPRFDEGHLRVVLALTSAPFAAALAAFAVRSSSSSGAVGRTLGFACVLGVASTIVPSAILSWNDHTPGFFGCVVFGVFFGIPTGFLYGIPLAVLAGFAQRHVQSQSLAGTDRAARTAGIWLAVTGVLVTLGSIALDGADPTQLIVAGTVVIGSLAAIRAHLRLRARDAWIERVRDGLEPKFRLRTLDVRDDVRALPRLAAGHTVVEWIAEDAETSVYRFPAIGVPVALVDVNPAPRD